MAAPPVSLDEFKQFLSVKASDDTLDEQLTGVLAAASDLVESVVGPMVPRDVTETIRDVAWDGSFIVGTWPVVEVTDVVDHYTAVVIDVATLDVNLRTGVVSGSPRSCGYDVTLSVGRSPVPEALKEATKVVGEQLWQTRRGPAGLTRFAQGGVADAGQVPVSRGFAWPNRAMQLVEPYRQLWVA